MGQDFQKQRYIIRYPADRYLPVKAIETAPLEKPLVVTIDTLKRKRSTAQNDLMWMWVHKIQDHLFESSGQWFEDQDIKNWLREHFIPTRVVEIEGEVEEYTPGTSELNVEEFSNFLNMIDWYSIEQWGLTLPHPDDLYWEAFGGSK